MSAARGSRHAARRRALEILYEADLIQRPLPQVLAGHLNGDDVPPEFAVDLVRGVHRHAAELDELIAANAKDWALHRMPVVDRNLLRMGCYELLHLPDVPTAVAIDEAVELAKELSTDDSPRFINGVLARIAETAASPAPAPPPEV